MRLHHLSMTAFGPFPATEEVDFDELCDAGLFLLTGPTGAGKTTVLDAVCFALYGSVPGVRGVKTLKSQHAPAERAPEVVLDFSVRERRFVVRRTPEWSRPKRRGEGTTTVNASATLVERTSGEDHLLSSRAQEVGHFIGELVGMQATQFVQVAMLPQGDFQKFLRASSQDRHDVLQHLFRTKRYARIEDWVQDHSRSLKDRSTQGLHGVARVLDTVAERAGEDVPDDLDAAALHTEEAQQAARRWVAGLVDSAARARASAASEHEAAVAARTEARAAHEAARAVRALHDRREQARSLLAELARDETSTDAARDALEAAARAGHAEPLLRMLDQAESRHRELTAAWTRVAAALVDEPGLLDDGSAVTADAVTADAVAAREQEVRGTVSRLEALLPRERELEEARAALTAAEAALARVAGEQQEAESRGSGLPARLEEARVRVSTALALAGRLEALTLERDQARRRAEAAREADTCAQELRALEDAARAARDRAADARERVQELTARRLAGIAAELAGSLEPGRACQVCGSCEHPSPAAASSTPVTDAEQADAQADHDAATSGHTAAAGRVLQARERLEGLRATAGGIGPDAAAEQVRALDVQVAEATRARDEAALAEAELDLVSAEQVEVEQVRHDLAVRSAALVQTLDGHSRTVDRIAAELSAELDGLGTLAERVARLSSLADVLARAGETRRAVEAASERLTELEAQTRETAAEHGFADLVALRAACLDPLERSRLAEVVEERSRAAARAEAVLAEGAVRDLPEGPPPDLEACAAVLRRHELAEEEAARALHLREDTLASLRRLRDRLDEALAAWAPVLADYVRAESMSRLVRGMSADNQLQMRLSAYVLATRLDQVVAAANERLAHMRDQRYLLQRTGRAARKGAQAGLGLEVLDQWTGDVRDPATLSGGETFVVALALALGLADVVTQETGGTEIETLFVDEGFGTLDADTLDDVMDRLDDLRAGGRAVGVVSHVSELRNRIPMQLHVEKARSGSVVRVRTAVG